MFVGTGHGVVMTVFEGLMANRKGRQESAAATERPRSCIKKRRENRGGGPSPFRICLSVIELF